MEKVQEYLVVSSINPETKEREFISVDDHSGGYIYWGWLSGCKHYKSDEFTVEKVVQHIKGSYLYRQDREVFMSKVVVHIEEETKLDNTQQMIKNEKRRKLEATIAEAEAKLRELDK